jgi:hypothetical protein
MLAKDWHKIKNCVGINDFLTKFSSYCEKYFEKGIFDTNSFFLGKFPKNDFKN